MSNSYRHLGRVTLLVAAWTPLLCQVAWLDGRHTSQATALQLAGWEMALIAALLATPVLAMHKMRLASDRDPGVQLMQ